MDHLPDKLQQLGLAEYLPILVQNGFATWDIVLEIKEHDLEQLGFKLGHRRILQKEIEKCKEGQHDYTITPQGSGSSTITPPNELSSSPQPVKAKRRYRWHPRPDTNAPKRPKTAYVRFSDQLRRDPEIMSMSFVDIAKEVGSRWQNMESSVKQRYELEAAQDIQLYEDRMREYKQTASYQEYQEYLSTFRKSPVKAPRPKLQSQPPYDASYSSSALGLAPNISGQTFNNASTDAIPLTEEDKQLLSCAMAEFRRLTSEYRNLKPFHPDHHLSQELFETCILALVDNAGPLLYTWGEHGAKQLLDNIFTKTTADQISTAELYLASALGSCYCSPTIEQSMSRQLLMTGLAALEGLNLAELTAHRLLRILASLSIYSAQEKHMSCKALISAGLAIGRNKLSRAFSVEDVDTKRVYHTLLFIGCCLSHILPYSPGNLSFDVNDLSESNGPADSLDSKIQTHGASIALVTSEIAKRAQDRSDPLLTEDEIRHFSGRLDQWQAELPSFMNVEISIGDSANHLSVSQTWAILMVNLLRHGAELLLYRHLIVAAERSRRARRWKPDMISADFHKHEVRCGLAAHQIVRMVSAIHAAWPFSRGCWLFNHWAYLAGNVLLLRGAQSFREHDIPGAEKYLLGAQGSLETLGPFSTAEPIAEHQLALLKPSYDELMSHLQSPRSAKARVSNIHSLLDGNEHQDEMERSLTVEQSIDDVILKLVTQLSSPLGESLQHGEAHSLLTGYTSCTR